MGALGEKSGGASYAAMTSRIVQHAHATGTAHRIGCITVAASPARTTLSARGRAAGLSRSAALG